MTAPAATRTELLIASAGRLLTQNYRQQPVVMARGEGCRLYDIEGRGYLDFTAGIAVAVLGHGHPRWAEAVADQARRLAHVSNLYYIEPQIRLAEELVGRGFAGRIFFCNSGAEANEAALKLARRWFHHVRGEPERVELVAFEHSFHGRTVATVSATGQDKHRAGFGPLWEGVRFVPYGDIAALRGALSRRTFAVIAEPIQGEGGVRVPAPGVLANVRRACDEVGALLIFDEVQTGVGRTGRFYAHQHEKDARPDLVTLAKGLAGGFPIGAMIAAEPIADAFTPGSHASTFGGNPLACAAALATLEVIDREDLLHRARDAGAYLRRGLEALARRRDVIAEVRGRGLMLGLALRVEPAPLIGRAREAGLLLSTAGADALRIVPPLVLRREEIDEGLAILDRVLG